MGEDSAQSLEEAIGRYNEAWNDHDLDAIMSMHAPDMVFENHTAGESAQGEEVREPHRRDLRDLARHPLRDRGASTSATASSRRSGPPRATHSNTMRRGDLVAEPTGKRVEWRGIDVIPYEDGLVKRKDVYSDSVSILRQVGLLD